MEDISITFCVEEDKIIQFQTFIYEGVIELELKNRFSLTERYFRELYCYAYMKNDNFTYNLNSKQQ